MTAANIVFAGSYWRAFKMPNLIVLCFYYWNGRYHDLITQESFPNLNETLRHIDSKDTYYPVIFTTSGIPYSDSIEDDKEHNNVTNNFDLFGDLGVNPIV